MTINITTIASKGSPLTPVEMDANFTALKAAAEALAALVVTAPAFSLSADGTSLVIAYQGQTVATIPIPISVQIKWRGAYVVGATYDPGDLVFINRSTYRVKKNFQAVAPATDLAAGNFEFFSLGGGPGYIDQGAYDATKSYNLNDSVLDASGNRWVWNGVNSSVVGTAPGTGMWGVIAVIPGHGIASAAIQDTDKNLPLSATLAQHVTEINALIDNINMLVSHASISGATLTGAPSPGPNNYTPMTKV